LLPQFACNTDFNISLSLLIQFLIQFSNSPPISHLGAPAPPPLSEKPKWKPPPVVERVKPIDGEEDADAPQTARVPVIGVPTAAPVPAIAPEETTSPSTAAAESEHPIAAAGAVPMSLSPPPSAEASSIDEAPVAAHEPNEEQAHAAEAEQAAEEDPEEAERQRRAAIAARMARLGGARVGMAPMFGGPPPIGKKPVPTPTSKPVRKPSGEEGMLF
jgi:myosin tail region-interacting protein MTI1